MKNNKKILKLICCVLVLIFCISAFVGCNTNILETDSDRYREVVALKVGLVEVTMGELIDWFNRNAISYLNQGYDVQSVWDGLYPSFVQQRMFMNEALIEFNADSSFSKNTSARANKYKNGGYMVYSNGNDPLTAQDAEFSTQAAYRDKWLVLFEKTAYLSILDALKSSTETRLVEQDYVFDEAEEATTRADMIGKNGAITKTSLWEDEFNIDSDIKDVNKKLEVYPEQDYSGAVKFVFSENDVKLQDAIDKLNDRINTDEDDAKTEVTKEDYIAAQKYALRTVTKNIKSNNGKSIAEYLTLAVEEQIESQLANFGQAKYYKQAEATITLESFTARLNNLTQKFLDSVAKDRASFESFITGLNSESFIYNVPAAYQGEYRYVRNLLIPFSDAQSATLTQLSSHYGSTSPTFIEQRYNMAKKIEVKKYSYANPDGVEPDEADPFQSILDFVDIDAKNSDPYAAIKVTNAIKNMDANGFRKLIYDYGTDGGSINPAYGYVIGKNGFDYADSGSETFVKEFADAARVLANNPSQKVIACVTTYGVHIMFTEYVSAGNDPDLVKQNISVPTSQADFDAKKLDYGIEGGKAFYRFYKLYYDEIKTDYVTAETEKLVAMYKNAEGDRKVVVNEKELKKFMSQYGGKFTNDYKQ